jgi:uncharacterized protein YdeI (YjbR/CyaY-like superfamily)
MKPTFFATPSEFRAWLEEHHDKADKLWVGFHRRSSGNASITWPEAVDEALCFGWIDSVRKKLDDVSYVNRFTPRKARSTWSAVNIARVQELTRLGRMRPAGLKAFEQRSQEKSAIYSYEQRSAAKLNEADEHQFRANTKAWDFFQAQPAWYRRTAVWWVTSAMRPETRSKRLAKLIEDSEHGRTIPPLTRPSKSEPFSTAAQHPRGASSRPR